MTIEFRQNGLADPEAKLYFQNTQICLMIYMPIFTLILDDAKFTVDHFWDRHFSIQLDETVAPQWSDA